ncbi:MAG: type II toxin-antitoxin system RelE/ParE family toxin [Acidobacteria bacterium]|nr:type II toxin-antitoxin system RelE/ParE family toxin [Acidobacteriota bacterium]
MAGSRCGRAGRRLRGHQARHPRGCASPRRGSRGHRAGERERVRPHAPGGAGGISCRKDHEPSGAGLSPFAVEFSPSAARTFRKLPPLGRSRLREALERLASDVAQPGRISGKRVKTVRGSSDSFHRLRVGDHRVMYDVLAEDRVLLVLGIVHRRDLDRWLRSR